MKMIIRPVAGDFPEFYGDYVLNAAGEDLAAALEHAADALRATFRAIPAERHEYRYAPGKWSVKQVLQHIVDCERVFAYRALCIARGETKDLPGFDEDAYAAGSGADHRELTDILREHDATRSATMALFEGMEAPAWTRKGMANSRPITPQALGWIIAGHAEHHLRVIRERYC
jgi:uncharacterized damage-inducible protein DinB